MLYGRWMSTWFQTLHLFSQIGYIKQRYIKHSQLDNGWRYCKWRESWCRWWHLTSNFLLRSTSEYSKSYSHQDDSGNKTEVVCGSVVEAVDCSMLFHYVVLQQAQCQLFLIHMDISCWQLQESDWSGWPSVHWRAWEKKQRYKLPHSESYKVSYNKVFQAVMK